MATSVNPKRKTPSPSMGRLNRTLSSLSKSQKDWNPSMKKVYGVIGAAQQSKEEAQRQLPYLTSTFIIKSIDPETGTSGLKREDLKELLQSLAEEQSSMGPGGIDYGSADNLRKEPEQGNRPTKPAAVPGPKMSAASPKTVAKLKHATKASDVASADSEPKIPLAVLRAEELAEEEKEKKELYEKIDKKDEQLRKLEGEMKTLKAEKENMKRELEKVCSVEEDRQKMVMGLEHQLEVSHQENTTLHIEKNKVEAQKAKMEEYLNTVTQDRDTKSQQIKDYQKALEKAYKDNMRKIDALKEDHEREIRTINDQLSGVIKERDDLKTRFSKLAGAKLTDQNADIADLSDPNRAMKVSERFGTLYDDEWTDAFEELKKKKVPVKDSVQFLLSILQDCLKFCNTLKDTQMDSLNNVLLHPSQEVTKFVTEHRKNVGGLKEKPRISSKDEKAVRALRRLIGVSNTCLEEVKQVFVMETKSWDKRGYDKKHLELCIPYLQKCAEICWLMVLHDPPLYMKTDAKSGDKFDINLYTVYASSGEKIDYLVWPPLYNEFGGGLISKGAAECIKTIKKK